MKVPLSWLREYVEVPVEVERLAEALTLVGLAVEGIDKTGGDAVLDVDVTTNRVDCMNVYGVARELSVIYGRPLKPLELAFTETGAPAREALKVEIEAQDLCPRFCARVFDIRLGPSPAFVRDRLEQVGVRPISNLVDLTNYVMMEMGHPSHAFDLGRIPDGQLKVRWARAGEKVTTLDGAERVLAETMGVVAGPQLPLALAGIMGGATSEVSEDTRVVALEAAYWDPAATRRTAKALGMHTEASHRFERGADPEGVVRALDRLASLTVELAGGTVLREPVDSYPGKAPRAPIPLTWQRVADLLGFDVSRDEIADLLRRLEISAVDVHKEGARFLAPSFRGDITRDVDLVEEVARLRGYHKIPSTLPAIRLAAAPARRAPVFRAAEAVNAALRGSGLHEAVNFGFVDAARIAAMRFAEGDRRATPLVLKNPIATDLGVMRTSLLPWLLANASHNERRGVPSIHLFEVGRVFLPRAEIPAGTSDRDARLPEERLLAAGIRVGRRPMPTWQGGEAASVTDFFDAKGAVDEALDALGLSSQTRFQADVLPYLHPRASARVFVGDKEIGVVGELEPEVARAFELAGRAYVFELDLTALAEGPEPLVRFAELPRFPAVYRDMAVVVDRPTSWARIRAEIIEAGGGLCREVRVFDVYTGRPVPEDKKSVAFAVTYQAPDRTLTDDEVGRVHEAIRQRLEVNLDAHLRE